MAVPSGTFESYDAIGQREDISELIFNISPTETPILSAAGTSTATQSFHQWQTDSLQTPTGTNAASEGDDPALTAATPSVLVGNYNQITTQAFGVSGTLEVTDKYGRDSELAYQAAKTARYLKNEVDMAIGGVNNASVSSGSSGTPRESGSLEAWLESNTSIGAGGVDGGFAAGIVTARQDGTLRAFTQAQLDTVIQSAWDNGGKPTMIVTGAYQKTNLSAFDGLGNAVSDSTARTDRASRTIYATADSYYSNFGILNVVPSRHIRKTAGVDRNVFCIDPEYLKVAYLRPWQQFDLAKTGDSIKRQMLVEWTLEVCNEAAHGLIADVDNT